MILRVPCVGYWIRGKLGSPAKLLVSTAGWAAYRPAPESVRAHRDRGHRAVGREWGEYLRTDGAHLDSSTGALPNVPLRISVSIRGVRNLSPAQDELCCCAVDVDRTGHSDGTTLFPTSISPFWVGCFRSNAHTIHMGLYLPVQVPLHGQLSRGFDHKAVERLIQSN